MPMRIFFRYTAWLLVAAVAVFTLAPIEFRPATTAPADLERFAAFAVIGGAFCLGYPTHRVGIILLVIGIAGLLELAQNIVPGRHGHPQDGIVKVSGALLGAAVAVFLERGLKWRK
jgi:hypothetical protein